MQHRHLTVAAGSLAVLLAAGCASVPGAGGGEGGAATQRSSPSTTSAPASTSPPATTPEVTTTPSVESAGTPAPVIIDPKPDAPARVHLDTTVTVRGKEVLACPPRSSTMEAPEPKRCDGGVPLTGIDVDRLTKPMKNAGTLTSYASLTADYDGRRLTVIDQQPADPRAQLDPAIAMLDAPLSCPAPTGGWTREDTGVMDNSDVQQWILDHPDEYGDVAVAYPVTLPKDQQQSGSADTGVVVTVIGATGDLDTARTELERVFTGNLCVVRSTHSHREIYTAFNALQGLSVTGNTTGLFAFGPGMVTRGDPVLRMEVDRWTPRLDDIWHKIGAPDLQLIAWMRAAD